MRVGEAYGKNKGFGFIPPVKDWWNDDWTVSKLQVFLLSMTMGAIIFFMVYYFAPVCPFD